MSTAAMPTDCPLCYSAGAVIKGWCQLCEATFEEDLEGAVDLPPAAPSAPADAMAEEPTLTLAQPNLPVT